MLTLKIKVTKEILQRSANCGIHNGLTPTKNCAIALALIDIFPDAIVCNRCFYFDETSLICVSLPVIAAQFIKSFDNCSPEDRVLMPEIEFNIKIPDSIVEKINIDELRPLLENHPTLALMP